MTDKMDLSLDEIIKSTRGSRPNEYSPRYGHGRGGQGQNRVSRPFYREGSIQKNGYGYRGRGAVRYNGLHKKRYNRADTQNWRHDMYPYEGPKRLLGAGLNALRDDTTAKLIISNLDYSVSEGDIHELFIEFGPIISATVHYDRSGRSLGDADVVFERRADAFKAMKRYNSVPLDGRPMNIQFATSNLMSLVRPRGYDDYDILPKRYQNSMSQRRGGNLGYRRVYVNEHDARNQRAGYRYNQEPFSPPITAAALDAELDEFINKAKNL